MSTKRLSRILDAATIAVIGASDDLAKVGGRVVHLLRNGSYSGTVYPINPKREAIQGLRCYASVGAISESIDLCVIAVAASDVEDQVNQCLAAGVGGLIVLSSGYAEQDAEGAHRQARLAALVGNLGVPMIGPNCLGVMNGNNGLAASSTFAINDRTLIGGKLSFATQSGAIGTYWLDMVLAAGHGVANWVSTGNEADVDLAEILDYLADDPKTAVIGLYIEGIRNGALFRRAAAKALAMRKPVLVLKAGASSVGAHAAASHTGALAGEDALYQAFFDQHGICRVQSLSEMLDVSRVLLMQPVKPGKRTCVVSVSGGAAVLVTDAAIAGGLEIPEFSQKIKSRLKAYLPSFATPQNPLDVTAQVATDPDLLGKVLRVIVESDEFDEMVVFCGGLGNLQQQLSESIIHGIAGWDRPTVVIWQASRALAVKMLGDAGIPVFSEIPPAVTALCQVTRMAGYWDAPPPQIPPLEASPVLQDEGSIPSCLTEQRSKAFLLQRSGLKYPNGVLVGSGSEVKGALSALKGPFAAKLQCPEMIHKSGSGGIRLGLSETAAVQAVNEMLALARSHAMTCEGVLLEEMIPIQFEFLVGLRRDPVLGPLLVIGRGGVSVEVDPDIVRVFLPATHTDVLTLLMRLRTSKLFTGFRGKGAAPLDEIARVVASLGEMFLADQSIREVEVNPLVCSGNEVMAVDASVWLSA
ncbi:MAG: acetate--CoA ligase family protein [Comamonadaceae bacterium]|nr:acetate--CoA ligase family protein [Comamonadaceae bacterium]